jgi:hypothetical protein
MLLMQIILSFFIFCLILFLYLHIIYHTKTNNDLEIYEIKNIEKDKLEEICDLRQPIILNNIENIDNIIINTSLNNILKTYSMFKINIKNISKEQKSLLPLNIFKNLLEKDSNHLLVSEKNNSFINESSLHKQLNDDDKYFVPYMMSNKIYDIILGTKNAYTKLKYELNYRNYFIVTQGNITIKLIPPKNKKYLFIEEDYENLEFSSPINVWNIQEKYKQNFEKIKCLEINLNVGDIVHIPAYWWYSIKFNELTSITTLKYKTYMNNISILPQLFIHVLQLQNIYFKGDNKYICEDNIKEEKVKEESNEDSIKDEKIKEEDIDNNIKEENDSDDK